MTALLIVALLAGCNAQDDTPDADPDEGPMEKAGKKMDEMADKTAKKMDAMGDQASAALSAAYLHTKVRGKLLDGVGMDALRIEIDVKGDHVILNGTVREANSPELAVEMVETLEGVESVESKLVHKPASSDDPDPMETAKSGIADAVLATKVRVALLDAIGTDGVPLDIDVADGVVVLSGAVPDEKKAEAAAAAARGVENVKSVENELTSGS
jgi:osmotically-inducible protein OsmY